MVRRLLLIASACVLCLAPVVAHAAERAWKTGTWQPRSESRGYVVETERTLVTTAAPSGADDAALAARDGAEVRYVLEKGTIVLRDAHGGEHPLAIVSSAEKYSGEYNAVGGGHLVKTVAADGSRVTLEDGSRWDMDESRRFAIAEWQNDDLIFVRRHPDDPDFAFDLENTTQDDGALANHRVR
jgi:hypothetical protein